MLGIIEVTENTVSFVCNPSYDDVATCDPDSGWCAPDTCPPQF